MDLYPEALDAGMAIEVFWNSSIDEIVDMINSHIREENRKHKQKVIDDFVIAEVTALNLAALFSKDKNKKLPKPWDYYKKTFEKEKLEYEAAEEQHQLEEYKEKRREYVEEYNKRRQQGLV